MKKGKPKQCPHRMHSALAYPLPSLLVDRLMQLHSFSETEAKEGFEETKKYLIATCYWGAAGSPTSRIDKVWHEFLLFTKQYHEFCGLIGTFAHHIPAPEIALDAAQGYLLSRYYTSSLASLLNTFGSVNSVWWHSTLTIDGRQYPDLLGASRNKAQASFQETALPAAEAAEIQRAGNLYRQANQLNSSEQTWQWLSACGLTLADFTRMIELGVRTRKCLGLKPV